MSDLTLPEVLDNATDGMTDSESTAYLKSIGFEVFKKETAFLQMADDILNEETTLREKLYGKVVSLFDAKVITKDEFNILADMVSELRTSNSGIRLLDKLRG